MPYFANNQRYPSEIRRFPDRLREKLVLPYLVVNHPGHMVTLCESFDFTLFKNLCIEYNMIGIQCMSEGEHVCHQCPFLSNPHKAW